MYYVYTLSDPETNVPFYVGYTKNFGSRYRSHLRAKESSPTAKHVQEMLSKESVPTFKIVATFDDKMSALEHEQKLISELSESMVLLNVNRANLDNPSPYYLMTHKLCGIDGLYCKRVYQCEICHEIERQYRTAMIEKALSGAPETLMLIVGGLDEVAALTKPIRDVGGNYIVVNQLRKRIMITDTNVYTVIGDLSYSSISRDDAIEFLCREENMFSRYGNPSRYSTKEWKISSWRSDFGSTAPI